MLMFGLALTVFLKALKVIPAAIAVLPEVKETINAAITTIHTKDQGTAKTAYQHLIADNDEGYAELDRLLAEAEQQ